MKIQKLLHSCLLVEENGTRILIDPGEYCFIEGLVIPEKLAPIDAILVTHSHADHCDTSAIKKINPKKIFGDSLTARKLEKEGIASHVSTVGQIISVGSFQIQVIRAPHDQRLSQPMPESLGFILNDKLLHPGDSLDFDTSHPYTVLALPIAAPWMVRREALDLGVKLKPPHIIPIHDGNFKEFALKGTYETAAGFFKPHGIQFHPLKPGELLEL